MNLIYFIFPFFGLIIAVKNFFSKKRIFPFVFFGFWFGYSIFPHSGDLIHYIKAFPLLQRYSWIDFFTIVLNTYSRDGVQIFERDNLYHQKPDLFAFVLAFLVSRFTEKHSFFFGLLGSIYFSLLYVFLRETLKYTGYSDNKNYKIFFIFLAMIVPFYVGVTGVRFWTALFFYGFMLLKYINTKNIKFIFLSAISSLIHYTFILPIFITFLSYFFKINRYFNKILIVLGTTYALTLRTTQSLNFMLYGLKNINITIIEESASQYFDENILLERQADALKVNWYVKWREDLIKLFFLFFYLYDFFIMRRIQIIKFSFFEGILDIFFLLSIFTFNLGSISRFLYIFYILALIRLIEIHIKSSTRYYSIWSKLALPVLTLHIVVSLRAGFYFVDPLLLFMPSFFLLFVKSDINLSELLVGH